MKYIENNCEDIYFNLAFEEYIFRNFLEDDCFILWKNDNSIVLGKYQNAFEELNIKEVEKTGTKVARRISGGGTVFHDKGNLNYSVILNHDKSIGVNYDDFILPIIEALNKLGVKAKKRRTSEIVINHKKISGNAQYSRKGRVLHHGTLLFDSDLELLEKVLKTTEGKVESKSVKSIRSSVTNISNHLDRSISIDDFKEELLKTLFPDGINKVQLNDKQVEEVQTISDNKYRDWNWNFGKSPNFTFEKDAIISNQNLKIKLGVKKGVISNANIISTAKNISLENVSFPCSEIENKIIGSRYDYKEIKNKLGEILVPEFDVSDLADFFF